MTALLLQGAALFSLTAAAIPKLSRILLVLSLCSVLASLAMELTASGFSTFALPWAIAASATLLPLAFGIRKAEFAGLAGGVVTALAWPACSAFVWQSEPGPPAMLGASISGVFMAAITGLMAISLCIAFSRKQTSGDQTNRQALALSTMLLILILPWAGEARLVPLALSGEHLFGPAESLRALWTVPPNNMPIETLVVAKVPSVFLSVLRQITLAATVISLGLWLWGQVMGNVALRQLLAISTTTTALLGILIPITAIGVAFFGGGAPEELLSLAAQLPTKDPNFRRLIYAPDAMQIHLLGLPVAAAVLPAISIALLKSIARPVMTPPIPNPEHGSSILLWPLALQFTAILYMLLAPQVGGGSMALSQSPWPAILAATIITTVAAILERYSLRQSRILVAAIWIAFAILITGLIGVGEGWLVS